MTGYDGIVQEVEEQCRKQSIYMLGPRKAQFLKELILDAKPQCVIECGTATTTPACRRLCLDSQTEQSS